MTTTSLTPIPDVRQVAGLDARSSIERRLSWLAWLIPSLLMAVLGGWRVGRPGLWGDELATWGMTRARWSDMPGLLGERDAVLGPYYLLMHGWTSLAGDSDVVLRLPSVLAMTGAAALIAMLGSRLADRRVGLLSGLLFAVLPTSSRYAQEARPYALATFATVLATLLLTRALDRPSSARLAAYTGAVALLGATHAIALALVAAHGSAVILTRRDVARQWVVAAGIGGLPGVALLWSAHRQTGQIAWIELAEPAALLDHPQRLFSVALLAGAVLILAVLCLSLRPPAAVYTCWALVPSGCIFAAGMITSLWTARYLLFTIPAWVLLACTTLGRVTVARGMAVVMFITVFAGPAHLQLREPDGHGQGTRDIAALLTQQAEPGDGIVYSTRSSAWVGRDTVAHYLSGGKRPRDLLALTAPRVDGHLLPEECPDTGRCLEGCRRVWVLEIGKSTSPLTNLDEEKRRALLNYRVAAVWRPEGLTLTLLILGAG